MGIIGLSSELKNQINNVEDDEDVEEEEEEEDEGEEDEHEPPAIVVKVPPKVLNRKVMQVATPGTGKSTPTKGKVEKVKEVENPLLESPSSTKKRGRPSRADLAQREVER